MTDNKNIIGRRINTLLAETGKKQKELAECLGVKDNVVSYFCSGTRVPNTNQIVEIAKFFRIPSDFLLGLSNVKSTDPNVQNASNFTGLSDKAVETLHFIKEHDSAQGSAGISKLLETYQAGCNVSGIVPPRLGVLGEILNYLYAERREGSIPGGGFALSWEDAISASSHYKIDAELDRLRSEITRDWPAVQNPYSQAQQTEYNKRNPHVKEGADDGQHQKDN